jgi:5-methylcytosine-specific restriction endonuclease McrA
MPTRPPFHRPQGWHPTVRPKKRDPFYVSRQWIALRANALLRDGYRCTRIRDGERCAAAAVTVHHVVPRTAGGPDALDNLRSLCRGCDALAHPEKGGAHG